MPATAPLECLRDSLSPQQRTLLDRYLVDHESRLQSAIRDTSRALSALGALVTEVAQQRIVLEDSS